MAVATRKYRGTLRQGLQALVTVIDRLKVRSTVRVERGEDPIFTSGEHEDLNAVRAFTLTKLNEVNA